MNIRTLDLNLLRVFAAIYSERNVSLAAQRESLSQPAMSNALARLRRSFDDALFVKTGGRMEPTAVARRLMPPVQEALALLTAGLSERARFDPTQSERTFKLLMSDAGESAVLPALVRKVSAMSALAAFEVVKLPHEDYAAVLQNGGADLATGNLPFLRSGFERTPLFDDPYCVVLRRGHALEGRRLGLSAFAAAGHVAVSTGSADALVERQLAKHRLKRRVRLKVSHYHVAVDVVARSDLIATVPRMVAPAGDEITVHPLPLKVEPASVQMVWHAVAQGDPGHQWLRQLLSSLDLQRGARAPTPRRH
jgi:DNA-binding transcriptional LysR family regulator